MKANTHPSFAQNPLDRMDELREDKKALLSPKLLANAFFILSTGEALVVQDNEKEYLFEHHFLLEQHIALEELVFLGQYQTQYYFALSLQEEHSQNFKSLELRDFALTHPQSEHDLGILAQAFSILKWHSTHTFCPNCGSITKMMHAGWRRDCIQCNRQHFPRLDPVVIMLVTHGEYCLLGSGIQPQRYSCLAGFIEPGETIEDAARRELYEEVGVLGLEVEYCRSQPWPFPFNLMIGVQIRAASMELKINHKELTDAQWVHQSVLKEVFNETKQVDFSLPSQIAIARILLEDWVKTFDKPQ